MPPKKSKQKKRLQRWQTKKKGETPQISGDQEQGDQNITKGKIPCELCGLKFNNARSYKSHQRDPMHMEMLHLANMKEAATLTYLQSHSRYVNEQHNICVDLENPNAGITECEFCYCNVKEGSENNWSLHEKAKHHFIAKRFQQRHCNVCIRLGKPGSHISNLWHETSLEHIRAEMEYEKFHDKLDFEKPFCQEENILTSSDHVIEMFEKFHQMKTEFEETFDASADYDPEKLYGIDKIDLRLRHYCLACKLPVGLNKGAAQAGFLSTEMHCLTPDHYAKMIKCLENNVSECKKEEKRDTGDNKNQDCTEEYEEAQTGSVVTRVCEHPECECKYQVDSSVVAHRMCINHSPCNEEGRYWIDPCFVCYELLTLAKTKGPEARKAIFALCKWVDGFKSMKSSLSKITNLYYSEEEKALLQSLHPRFAEDDSSDGSKATSSQPALLESHEDYHFDIVQSPSSSSYEVLLMPQKSFEDYGKAVLNKSESISELDANNPPFDRGFKVPADDHVFTAAYFNHARKEFTSYSKKGLFEWEEASLAFSFVPTNSDSITLLHEDFMKVFSSEKLSPTVAEQQLNIPLKPLSEDLLTKDLKSRLHLLDILNILLATETMATTISDVDTKDALIANAKLALRPLVHATHTFFNVRRILRRFALKGCEYSNPHVFALINSDPFSVKLFANDAVQKLIQECSAQSLTMNQLLGKSNKPIKRKLSGKNTTTIAPLIKKSKTSSN